MKLSELNLKVAELLHHHGDIDVAVAVHMLDRKTAKTLDLKVNINGISVERDGYFKPGDYVEIYAEGYLGD